MVTYNFSVGINKFAIAEEVITSAGNILVAAGFSADEIGGLFRQAAGQLETGEAIQNGECDPEHESAATVGMMDADDIRAEFNELPSVQSLGKLKMRADALDRPSDSPEALYKCYDLVIKMIPYIAEAQNWLKTAANEADVQIEEDQSSWIETASDADLDRQHEIIFLDDFDYTYRLNLDVIEQVAHALIDEGDVSAFNSLLSQLRDRRIALGSDLREALEKGERTLALRDTFDLFILSRDEEVMETATLDEFVRTHAFPEPSHFLTGWLKKLEENGKIQRYKRANRLRIQVL